MLRRLSVVMLLLAASHAVAQGRQFDSAGSAQAWAGGDGCTQGVVQEAWPSAELAAIAALGRLIAEAQRTGWDRPKYEHAGYVVERDGQYFATVPITQGQTSRVDFGCIIVPQGWRLAAIFHSHPADPVFSPLDKREAARLRVPGYIGTLADAEVLSYVPATGTTTKLGTIDATDPKAVRFTRSP